MAEKKKFSMVDLLRKGPVGQAVDKAIDVADKIAGPSGKAWLANGLDELRQAVQPAFATQVGPGTNPGLHGTITTGEATFDRIGDDHELPQKKWSMEDLLAYAKAAAKTADDRMEKGHGHEQDKGHEM